MPWSLPSFPNRIIKPQSFKLRNNTFFISSSSFAHHHHRIYRSMLQDLATGRTQLKRKNSKYTVSLSMALQPFGPWPLFRFLDWSVGPFGRGISPSKGRYLHTEQHKHRINAHTEVHASNVIRTHDPSVQGGEDVSCLSSSVANHNTKFGMWKIIHKYSL
jgi:hypothetical protein